MSRENRRLVRNQVNSESPDHRCQRQPPSPARDQEAERGSREEGGGEQRVEKPVVRSLFPLSELLRHVLQQEDQLWQRNEGLLQSLRVSPASMGGSPVELEGGGGDRASLKSFSPEYTEEEDHTRLYLIRYGQLTNVIHRYFRKLEKRHACLYLTGRKAKHENLRHVDVNRTSGGEEYGPETQSAGAYLADERQLAILRDEELLVYRCALMCAQFPMLSAPSPPEGHSPTPTIPALPLSFLPTTLGSLGSADLSRTAPSEYFSDTVAAGRLNGSKERNPVGELGQGSNSDEVRDKVTETQSLGTDPSRGENEDRPVPESAEQEDTKTLSEAPQPPKGPSPEPQPKSTTSPPPDAPELKSLWPSGSRPAPSDPIPIQKKLSGKARPLRDHKGKKDGGGAEPSAQKRPSRRVPTEITPAMDSGDESEVAELTATKSVGKTNAPKALAREHPFSPMVNREMLCNLVRCSFNQTDEQQLQHEQILRHEYGRRSKGEILAKELAGQLQVLENNAHPFYKPKMFVSRNGYDQWLQAEKQRIRSLIDKFWHYSLPRPQLWRHYNPTDYHRAFIILQQKVIGCESRTERREPVHSGRTPSAPLSPTAHRLLTEFGLRYGVGELYRRIVYLDYLAKHFDYEVWYIKHCTEELRTIRGLLPRNRNKLTAVRKEMELLRSTVHLLHGQTDNSLTRIDRLFHDSNPQEGVACLIELLSEVLDAEQSLFGKKVRPVDDWLLRYLKSGFVLRYERRKEIASDETIQSRTAQPFILTPALVNALLLSIRDEVHDYKENFQFVFRPYFDIVPFSKVEFYRLLCADACSLCARIIHRPETRQSLSLEMLGLMYRLNERDKEWGSVIPPDMQLWRRHFVDLALVWMDVLGKQINQWILQAVSSDQWTLLTFSTCLTGDPHSAHSTPSSSRHVFGIKAAVRPSPFPSPMSTPHDNAAFPPSFLGTRGAFVPYQRSVPKRRPEKGPSSESSGAVTDISSSGSSLGSHSSAAIAETVDVMAEITAFNMDESGTAGNDSLLRFGQVTHERGRDKGWSRDLDFSESTANHAHEVEITASVYEGYKPLANPTSHHGAQPPPTSAILQNGGDRYDHHNTESPLQRAASSGDHPQTSSSNGTAQPSHLVPQGTNSHHGTPETRRKDMQLPPLPHGLETRSFRVSESSSDATVVLEPPAPAGSTAPPPMHPTRLQPSMSHPPLPELQVVRESGKNKKLPQLGLPQHAGNLRMNGDMLVGRESPSEFSLSTDCNPSLSIDALDPSLPIRKPELDSWQTGSQPVVRFGNILDGCASGDSAAEDRVIVKPKPVSARASVGNKVRAMGGTNWTSSESLDSSDPHIPPASIATVPGLAEWAKGHPSSFLVTQSTASTYDESKATSRDNTPSSSSSSSPSPSNKACLMSSLEDSQTPPISNLSAEAGDRLGAQPEVIPFLFPVSNSPVDIVTMLTRLASFTGVILQVLTPILKRNVFLPDHSKATQEYSSEVAMARAQASQQWRLAEDMKMEFLKKLHKAMLNALKLYADNLLCMDLCCWSETAAMKLLGEQMVYHLKRRKDMGEIWGCRHLVEARHGLHPHGTPCQKKPSTRFENITRDMCIRINNLQVLITIFASLESHLYTSTRTEAQKPATALGYISSEEAHEIGSPLQTHRASKSSQREGPTPHRTRTQTGASFPEHSPAGMSWRSSLTAGLGPMEPGSARGSRGEDKTELDRPEVGFVSRESLQVLDYLRVVQEHQLRLLCLRMNKFFKPALSLLLELKLTNCKIVKRLNPIVTFLGRHRTALRKYVYPECFDTIMKYLWEYIIQDLEEEGVKLRTMRRSVTDKAQMLLQAVAHLIEFMHDRGNGLSLDLLTSSSEYLLGLLDIMTRSTDQLINIFTSLSTPQFARSRMDLSCAPVAIDPVVLHSLRHHLHTYKKCFSGRDFVDTIIAMGNRHSDITERETESNTPSPAPHTFTPSPHSFSPIGGTRIGSHVITPSGQVISPTGQIIIYTVHYATEVAQHLVNERVLLPVATELAGTSSLTRNPSYLSLGGGRREELLQESGVASDHQHLNDSSDGATPMDSARRLRSQVLRVNGVGMTSSDSLRISHARPHPQASLRSGTENAEAHVFTYSSQVFYKFVDVEDLEADKLFQSQIVSSVSHQRRERRRVVGGRGEGGRGGGVGGGRGRGRGGEGGGRGGGGRGIRTTNNGDEFLEFHRARYGTVFLVLDLLAQRVRKDRRAKEFYQSPRASAIILQRRQNDTSCDQIFKM